MNWDAWLQDPAFKGAVNLVGFSAEMYDTLLRTKGVTDIYVWDDKKVPVPTVGTFSDFLSILRRLQDDPYPDHLWIVCGVASTAQRRSKALNGLYAWFKEPWTHFPTLISDRADVSPLAKVSEEGVYVGNGAYVGPYTYLAAGACLLAGARVCHDCRIGEDTVVVCGATVLGRSDVGPRCFLCAGAVVLPDGRLTSDVTVGVGGACRRVSADSEEDA